MWFESLARTPHTVNFNTMDKNFQNQSLKMVNFDQIKTILGNIRLIFNQTLHLKLRPFARFFLITGRNYPSTPGESLIFWPRPTAYNIRKSIKVVQKMQMEQVLQG